MTLKKELKMLGMFVSKLFIVSLSGQGHALHTHVQYMHKHSNTPERTKVWTK